jgi:hypothetical protein
MTDREEPAFGALAAGTLPLLAAADLQDALLSATNDLDRLQTLLAHACEELLAGFHHASRHIRDTGPGDGASDEALARLGGAITALQFEDMATQLIAHTRRRLRSCADRIAREAVGDDEDGAAVVEEAPLRPNPVTQDEMDAGSVELF